MRIKDIRTALSDYLNPVLAEYEFEIIQFHMTGFRIGNESKELVLRLDYRRFDGGKWLTLTPQARLIKFMPVEDIIQQLRVKHSLWKLEGFADAYSEGATYTFMDYYQDEKEREIKNAFSECQIASGADVMQFVKLAKNHFDNFCLSWFRKYSKLENVNEFINSTGDTENGRFFSQLHMFRKIIIKKFCQANDYEEYLEFWINRFSTTRDLEDGKYIPYLDACIELKSILSDI